MPQGTLDFNKFISSISLALDLAESCIFKEYKFDTKSVQAYSELDIKNHDFTSHSKKTALIALHLPNRLGYQGNRLNYLYIAAFLMILASLLSLIQY
jgi:HD-GYP domain-containing protein (c-di-GMP phosphodiesterase class II)